MQIIRIEHEDGKGLWRSNDVGGYCRLNQHSHFDKIMERHADESKFPTFYNDGELKDNLFIVEGNTSCIDYFFAFNSLEVVNEALTPEEFKEAIIDLGFKVYLLEVSECIQSRFQTLFKKENVISKQDISFMFV